MTWGYRLEPTNDTDARAAMREEARKTIQSQSILGSMVPGSVPLNAVNRAHTRVFYNPSGAADFTISATAITEVSPILAGVISCSGAPLLLSASIRAVEAGTSGVLALGFLLDGKVIPGFTDGAAWVTESTAFLGASFQTLVEQPRPGSRRFSLAAFRGTANGTIYAGAGNSVELIAMEV